MKFLCDCAPDRQFKCIDTRKSGDTVRRRYVCKHCDQRATTVEVVVAYDRHQPTTQQARDRIEALKQLVFNSQNAEQHELPGN